MFFLCFPSWYQSDVLFPHSVMCHGSSAEWSVVGAGGRRRRVGDGSFYWCGVVAGERAADLDRHPQHPHRFAAGVGAAAALC